MAKKGHAVTVFRAIFIVGCAIAAAVIAFFTEGKSSIANWEVAIVGTLMGGFFGWIVWSFLQSLIAEED